MELRVIFAVEHREDIAKLLAKIRNLETYCLQEGHLLTMEAVFMSDAVVYFKEIPADDELFAHKVDIALCNNALMSHDMRPITTDKIRTVPAGIGELVVRQHEGWIEYRI